MKKIDLGQTMSILANVGVLIGILLLVFELNQNRQMMRSQTRNSIAETLVDLTLQLGSNPQLAALTRKAAAGEPLTPDEKQQMFFIEHAFWRYRENVSYQYRNGLFDENEYVGQREVWRQRLNSDEWVRNIWCSSRDQRTQEFVAEIDSLLEEPCE